MASIHRVSGSSHDVELVVEERGTGEPPLVLVHGYTGARLDWVDVWDRLAERRRVVAYDQRGHLESTNVGDAGGYTFDHLVDDLGCVLDAVAPDGPVDLVGHSMGGAVAMRFALRRPDRLRSLVLMDTFSDPVTVLPAEVVDATVSLGRTAGMAAVAEMTAQLFASVLQGRPDADRLVARVRRKVTAMDVEAFAGFGLAIRSAPGVTGQLGAIDLPTTVLVGEDDLGLRAASDVLAERIPGARLVVVPQAGHSPQEDQPDAWIDAVEAHLARAHSTEPPSGAGR